jgi:hypothetical protein
MRQISGSDAFFLYADKPGRHQQLSTVYLYDPSTAPGEFATASAPRGSSGNGSWRFP